MYHSKSLKDDLLKNHVDRVWRVVKYESHRKDKLNSIRVVKGDVIKFGRVRFQVKKLIVDPSDIENSSGNVRTNSKVVPMNNRDSMTS